MENNLYYKPIIGRLWKRGKNYLNINFAKSFYQVLAGADENNVFKICREGDDIVMIRQKSDAELNPLGVYVELHKYDSRCTIGSKAFCDILIGRFGSEPTKYRFDEREQGIFLVSPYSGTGIEVYHCHKG